VETAFDTSQFLLSAHHGFDVFVGRWGFVTEGVDAAMIKPDAAQLALELAVRDLPQGIATAHRSARSVRARTERLRVPPAGDVKTHGSHRTGDQPRLAGCGRQRAFAVHPIRLAEVSLPHDVVVVAVDQRIRVRLHTEE
jgi:hypothetical protein